MNSNCERLRLDILMPTEEGRFIPQEVLEGMLAQGIPFRLWVSTKVSGGDYAGARNNIKQYGRSEWILMLDNDLILPAGAIQKMLDFLKAHPGYAAIALAKYPLGQTNETVINAPHVDMSCVLFRKAVFDQITFSEPRKEGRRLPEPYGVCECSQCCFDIRQMGLEIGFLTGLHAQHLPDTRFSTN